MMINSPVNAVSQNRIMQHSVNHHHYPNQQMSNLSGFQWNSEAFQTFLGLRETLMRIVQQHPLEIEDSVPDQQNQQIPAPGGFQWNSESFETFLGLRETLINIVRQNSPDIRETRLEQLDQQNSQSRPVDISQTVNLNPGASQSFNDSGLNGTHVISNQRQLNTFADKMGVPVSELPGIDFTKQVLVFITQDQADPNRLLNGQLHIDNDGDFAVNFASTRIGFQPSGDLKVHFVPLGREGLKTLATSNPNNSDYLSDSDTTHNPGGPDDSRYETLYSAVRFDTNAGFGTHGVRAEYQKTLENLYDESPTFKAVINQLAADGNTITYTRQPEAESHNINTDGTNSTVNINEIVDVSYVAYDPSTQDAYVKNEASLARLLVHETIHAATGLSDLAPLPDYIENLRSLESGQNLIDIFSEGFDGPDALAVAGIAPGPVVRLTNQILNESTTYYEDPRVDYNSLVNQDPVTVQNITTVLDQIIDEDFSTDNDYDLLFWDPIGQGQRFQ